MKLMNYSFWVVGNRSWILTLALTSLLSSGFDVVSKNIAIAAPIPQPIQLSQRSQNRPPRNIVNAIIRDASKRSGVAIRRIQVSQSTRKTFGNPCIFNFGEICTREYRPIEGWEVIVRVRNQPWKYHVNQSGSQILLDPQVNVEGNTLPKAIANNVLSDASKRSNIPRRELVITQAKPKTFGNSCEFSFGEICPQQYKPILGWEVVVRVQNQSWTYHVDRYGSSIVLDPKAVVAENNTLPGAIASNVIDDAIQRSGLSQRQIEITNATPKTFSNFCEFSFGEICTREYRPIDGWEVTVRVRNQLWTYNVDQSGSQVILDPRV